MDEVPSRAEPTSGCACDCTRGPMPAAGMRQLSMRQCDDDAYQAHDDAYHHQPQHRSGGVGDTHHGCVDSRRLRTARCQAGTCSSALPASALHTTQQTQRLPTVSGGWAEVSTRPTTCAQPTMHSCKQQCCTRTISGPQALHRVELISLQTQAVEALLQLT
jgi:hypothetical protein